MDVIRPPAVAGAFYPGDSSALASTLVSLLSAARSELPANAATPAPKVLIAPHAGYVYSGLMAARAYAQLGGLRERIRRVVLVGPAHRVPVRGLALPGAHAFATPLGVVEVDTDAVAIVEALPQVTVNASAHALEHSLEVQLPFLQSVLDDFKLLPLVVGEASADEVARVLDAVWGGDETLIVISSDLSHYLSYDAARATDAQTVERILALDGPLDHEMACGGASISALLLLARAHRLEPRLLGLCNSGDTAGDRRRVVGYAALAFSERGHVTH